MVRDPSDTATARMMFVWCRSVLGSSVAAAEGFDSAELGVAFDPTDDRAFALELVDAAPEGGRDFVGAGVPDVDMGGLLVDVDGCDAIVVVFDVWATEEDDDFLHSGGSSTENPDPLKAPDQPSNDGLVSHYNTSHEMGGTRGKILTRHLESPLPVFAQGRLGRRVVLTVPPARFGKTGTDV